MVLTVGLKRAVSYSWEERRPGIALVNADRLNGGATIGEVTEKGFVRQNILVSRPQSGRIAKTTYGESHAHTQRVTWRASRFGLCLGLWSARGAAKAPIPSKIATCAQSLGRCIFPQTLLACFQQMFGRNNLERNLGSRGYFEVASTSINQCTTKFC